MKDIKTLSVSLAAIVSLMVMQTASHHWMKIPSSSCDYLRIHHRSQKKKRLLAKRRGLTKVV